MGPSPHRQPNHQYTMIEESNRPGRNWAACMSRSRRYILRYPSWSTFGYWIPLTFLVSVSFLIGVYAARCNSGNNIQRKEISQPDNPDTDGVNVEVVDTVFQVFNYNRTFGEVSSNETLRAWDGLFPEQGGFFKHPTMAPKGSTFSVFHQLHCLVWSLLMPAYQPDLADLLVQNGIRQGYGALHEAVMDGQKITDEEMLMMSSLTNVRHCIDLLRQALMCQPDTTVEVKDQAIGGVKGFGTEHQCKDWGQLVELTRTWQTYEQAED